MDSKIGFEINVIVVEAIRGRCASFVILTATVSDKFGGQTNSSVSVEIIYFFLLYFGRTLLTSASTGYIRI